MQEKLESSPVGRLLISVFVVVTVAAMVTWNLPGSKLRREGLRVAEPYVMALGLDQNWAVFAPNPYRESFGLVARVSFADGTTDSWSPPGGGAALGSYAEFRWGKWAEWTIRGNAELCAGTAAYAANRVGDGGRRPVRVELFARRRPNRPPGQQPPHGEWQETSVCTVDVVAPAVGS